MVEKRVGIVTPLALEKVDIEFSESFIANFTYLQQHAHELPFKLKEIQKITPQTFPIDANRNECIARIKKHDCDISVWFDADQDLMNDATPERKPDVLFRLLRDGYNYPIYAGMYYLKKAPFHPIVFNADSKFKQFRPIWRFPSDKLFYADMIGMGCVKIDRSVIDKLDPPYFRYNVMPKQLAGLGDLARFKYENKVGDVSEDVAFWRQVKKITDDRIVVDPKIQVGHCTKNVITYGVFKAHLQGVLEQLKTQKGDKFDEWWETVCKAEELCQETE